MSLKEIIKNKHLNSDLRSLDKIWSTKSLKEIAELYAQQRVNEVLDKVADNFEKEIAVKSDYFNHRVGMFNAVKEAILKLKNK